MPLDGTTDDIEADYDVLDAIGAHMDAMIQGLTPSGAIQKTLRRWLVGHAEPPEDEDARNCLMAMAADLELFTPSASGRTLVDRYLKSHAPDTPEAQLASLALSAAQFRLVKIVAREGPDVVRLKDLVTQDELLLLDAHISPTAADVWTAMRLCPLASGRQVLISPKFAMDRAMFDDAMTFVRPGRALGHGHRCAASLYRNVARQGFLPLPQLTGAADAEAFLDFLKEAEDRLTPVQHLCLRWIAGEEAFADLAADARRLTSVENLMDACGCFGELDRDGPEGLRAAYEQIADLLVETMAHRARAGLRSAAGALDQAAAEIADQVARGRMDSSALDLLDRLRRRWAFAGSHKPADTISPAMAEMDRVIQRIQALRAKTVAQGCTEAEALAAAAKVSELLRRHDLTLDEVSVRQSNCEGVSVATGRKRRAPSDSCTPAIGQFCDCRVWAEGGGDRALRFVYFGLKADVEAARFLHEVVELAFETESAAFRRGEVYQALRGGDRRVALNSFQTGLASGIGDKLAALKAARHNGGAKSTGFDLVAVKTSVVDDDVEKLGLNFFTRKATSRARYLHRDAYQAGKVAGSLFEPNAALQG
jgi:hypothetical protein